MWGAWGRGGRHPVPAVVWRLTDRQASVCGRQASLRPHPRSVALRYQGVDHYCDKCKPVTDPYLNDMGDYLYEDDGDGIEPTEEDC